MKADREERVPQDVTPALIRDLEERSAVGTHKYGRPLSTFNGRQALQDAYEEALDLTQYLKQALMEQEARQRKLMPEPPRRYQVGGPPANWKHWAPLLDGVPVGHCTAFDVDEGWVQVWTLEGLGQERPLRAAHLPQRRFYGRVEALPMPEWKELVNQRGALQIGKDDPSGVPVPGTELSHPVRQ